MERAAFFSAFQGKKLKGVCFCSDRDLRQRLDPHVRTIVPSSGTYAYGGWPDVDELYKKQLTETDPEKRERDAARNPEDPARAHALRADLGLFLAERASVRASRTPR